MVSGKKPSIQNRLSVFIVRAFEPVGCVILQPSPKLLIIHDLMPVAHDGVSPNLWFSYKFHFCLSLPRFEKVVALIFTGVYAAQFHPCLSVSTRRARARRGRSVVKKFALRFGVWHSVAMTKPKIVAYLKPSCGWSQGVRAVLKKYDLPFEDRDIINDPLQRQGNDREKRPDDEPLRRDQRPDAPRHQRRGSRSLDAREQRRVAQRPHARRAD